jgi:hypothetical protein
MRASIHEFLIGIGVAAILAVLCVSWTVRDAVAQLSEVTRDDVLSVEQCISNNTDASIDPPEKKELIRAGIIEEDLDRVTITSEECGDILERTPGGTPLEHAIAASNVIQELNIIRRSMKVTVEGDVNGDGMVNAGDSRIASASSYAASQAAEKVIRAAISEEEGQGGMSEEINAELAAYLQSAVQDQYDNGGGGGGATEGNFVQKLPYKKAQQNGEVAARGKGASSKAAEAAGSCAAKVHLIGGAVPESIRANWGLDKPPKEMLWKDSDITKFRISPEVVETIEQLKQRFEEAGEPTVGCVRATKQMKADLIGSAFDIEERRNRIQSMLRNAPTEWEWEVAASNGGRHKLILNLSYDVTPGQEDGFHDVIPVPLDADIYVRVTPWQNAANFVSSNWQWLWTALLVPIAIWLWGRYKRSQERRDAEDAEQV